MVTRLHSVSLVCLLLVYLGGCTGTQSFTLAGRPGDTLAVAAGWHQELDKDSISITITDPQTGVTEAVVPRAVINAYPDPLSRLIVEENTDVAGGTESGAFWGPQIRDNITGGDWDYSQKVVFFDLPATISDGVATLQISGPGVTADPMDVTILPLAAGSGSSHPFDIQDTLTGSTLGVSLGGRLGLVERAPHHAVTFSDSASGPIPYAIEVTLNHSDSFFIGGTGVPYVTGPRIDRKHISWSDDGTQLKVILMPTQLSPILSVSDLRDYKFYVAGGLQNLVLGTVSAFDENGVLIPTISGSLQPNL